MVILFATGDRPLYLFGWGFYGPKCTEK